MEEIVLTLKWGVRFRDTVVIRESEGSVDGVIELAAGDGCWHTIRQYEANRRATATGPKPHARDSISIDSLDPFDINQMESFNELDFNGLEASLNKSSDFIDDDSDNSELDCDDQDGIANRISTAWDSFHTVKEKLWEDDVFEKDELREQHQAIHQCYVCSQ